MKIDFAGKVALVTASMAVSGSPLPEAWRKAARK